MRYATVVLDAGSRGFYPEYYSFAEKANVIRERIHYINLLDDDTIVMLYQLRGDLDQAKTELEKIPRVLRYDIAGRDDGLVYIHEDASEPARSLLSVVQELEIVLDTPLEFTTDGDLRATIIGESTTLQRALATFSDIVVIHLEKTGEYRPSFRDLSSILTDRQHQILSIAVQHGYYEVPRRATYKDIAAEVGLSQSTVGDHIQKIEATILSQVIR